MPILLAALQRLAAGERVVADIMHVAKGAQASVSSGDRLPKPKRRWKPHALRAVAGAACRPSRSPPDATSARRSAAARGAAPLAAIGPGLNHKLSLPQAFDSAFRVPTSAFLRHVEPFQGREVVHVVAHIDEGLALFVRG